MRLKKKICILSQRPQHAKQGWTMAEGTKMIGHVNWSHIAFLQAIKRHFSHLFSLFLSFLSFCEKLVKISQLKNTKNISFSIKNKNDKLLKKKLVVFFFSEFVKFVMKITNRLGCLTNGRFIPFILWQRPQALHK